MARIDALLMETVKAGASDLHMVPGFVPMLRVKGDLVSTKYNQLSHKLNEQLFFEIIAPEQQDRLKTNLELDYAYELVGVARFRCNFFYTMRGMAGVFRQIPSKIMTLEELGMPPGVQNILQIQRGLVLVVGPTGCGNPLLWQP